jgi:hypothetical protein
MWLSVQNIFKDGAELTSSIHQMVFSGSTALLEQHRLIAVCSRGLFGL